MCIHCTALLPLSLSQDMVELLRSLFPNDAALRNVKLGKQKATNIVRQVLGFDYLKELVSLLRCRFFSVIIDEATDQSTKKQLAIDLYKKVDVSRLVT